MVSFDLLLQLRAILRLPYSDLPNDQRHHIIHVLFKSYIVMQSLAVGTCLAGQLCFLLDNSHKLLDPLFCTWRIHLHLYVVTQNDVRKSYWLSSPSQRANWPSGCLKEKEPSQAVMVCLEEKLPAKEKVAEQPGES